MSMRGAACPEGAISRCSRVGSNSPTLISAISAILSNRDSLEISLLQLPLFAGFPPGGLLTCGPGKTALFRIVDLFSALLFRLNDEDSPVVPLVRRPRASLRLQM